MRYECGRVDRFVVLVSEYAIKCEFEIATGAPFEDGAEMVIDRTKLIQIFEGLGASLATPATICLIGSSPGIASGQPDRQSMDIDVWRQRSSFDETEFRKACQNLGVLFDPRDELDLDAVYIQIVRPGVVRLPADFELEVLAQYGKLNVVMPAPALLSAAKLARGDERDIEDVAWWIKERALSLEDIRKAVDTLPDAGQREAADANMILVELLAGDQRKPE